MMEKERPFTFLAREQERLMQREETIKASKDPNRFQVRCGRTPTGSR